MSDSNGNGGPSEEQRAELARQARSLELSRRAKEMHEVVVDPVTGRRKFGGPQPGSGRPRKRSAADELLKRLEDDDERKKVVDALFGGVDVKNKTAAHKAAERILNLEHRELELQLKEDEFDGTTKRELLEILAPVFADFQRRGIIPALPGGTGDTVDGTAVELLRGGTAGDSTTGGAGS